jgi:Uma2 family endonuclease
MEVLKKKLTYQEFRQLEFDYDDPFWYELINGELVKKQSPTIDHQRISREIEFYLNLYSKRNESGEVLHAPLDVVLDDGNAYQPDIFFIRKERFFIIDEKERIVMGAPDLVIEILSKSTAADDKGEKKDNYEKFGVRGYWLVDPVKKSFEVYTLTGERYKLTSYFEGSGVLKSSASEGFEMDVEQIFKDAEVGQS